MNPDPNSVIDLDVDKMLVSRESTRAFLHDNVGHILINYNFY